MAKSEAFEKLLFELGDYAREHLAERNPPLPGMETVYDAEDALVARRTELEALESQLNRVDEDYRVFLELQDSERKELQAVVKQYKRAVDAIEGKVKDLRKKLAAARAEIKMNREALRNQEVRQRDLEMTSDHVRVEQGRVLLKRLRVAILRKEGEASEADATLSVALTPEPGQPGAPGIEAHRRILAMEDEAVSRKENASRVSAELDAAIVAKEGEVQDAETDLTDSLFHLGDQIYSQRVPDPQLTGFYAKLDKLK